METKQELIEEAKRRGFTEPAMVKGIDGSKIAITQKGIDDYGYNYDEQMEALFFGEVLIYIRDTWAEIIDDAWKIEETPYLRIRKGGLVINCEHETEPEEGFERAEAEAIANALNELEE